MPFFRKWKSRSRIGLVAKNVLFACHRDKRSFLEFCFSCKDPHSFCITTAFLDLSDERSSRQNSCNICNTNVYCLHFGQKIESVAKTRILKISWVLSLLLRSKTCYFWSVFRSNPASAPLWPQRPLARLFVL